MRRRGSIRIWSRFRSRSIILWRDLASEPYKKDFLDFKGGVYYYGPKEIDRFLSAEWREHHEQMNARTGADEKELPPRVSVPAHDPRRQEAGGHQGVHSG